MALSEIPGSQKGPDNNPGENEHSIQIGRAISKKGLDQIGLEHIIGMKPPENEVDQLLLECRLTGYLLESVDLCNRHFKNFVLKLEMVDSNRPESVMPR